MAALAQQISNSIENSKKKVTVIDKNMDFFADAKEKRLDEKNDIFSTMMLYASRINIDNWIILLGRDSESNNGIQFYNNKKSIIDSLKILSENQLMIAYDIAGGIFAADKKMGNQVSYFAPDTLEWENLEMNYGQFLTWIFQGNTDEFYESMRWPSWQKDCAELPVDQGMLIYPFLWAKECDIETAAKHSVPIDELFALNYQNFLLINQK